MLAQNFKSPEELLITPQTFAALRKVLTRLETGDLVYADWSNPNNRPNGFNMGVHFTQYSCGTVGCIAGWAAFELKTPVGKFIDQNRILDHLFYPNRTINIDLDKVTTEQAAMVLRNYLTTGEFDWSEVVEVQRKKGR